ncbi:10611_t:CDS:2 [Acaulospora colombiana]|uniref:10611_t:CDS:1 n=1 Tax=Acaulospora colombiana TaxID=27376 RepID=A0ACA9NY24_9GLOM|nr:10611_t:CDS:2 [Acaulospora colombiana]
MRSSGPPPSLLSGSEGRRMSCVEKTSSSGPADDPPKAKELVSGANGNGLLLAKPQAACGPQSAHSHYCTRKERCTSPNPGTLWTELRKASVIVVGKAFPTAPDVPPHPWGALRSSPSRTRESITPTGLR